MSQHTTGTEISLSGQGRVLGSQPSKTRATILLTRRQAFTAISAILGTSCAKDRRDIQTASIQFTRVPQGDSKGTGKNDIIEGTVKGARPGQQIVLYAKRERWWVQPLVAEPFTPVRSSLRWTNATHLGSKYAALLVEAGYRPAAVLNQLPVVGGAIAAVAVVKGAEKPPSNIITFSGYEWRVRDAPSARGGGSPYNPANAWVDGLGALHLRIAKLGSDWTCAEVSLNRSLGYGTYQFVVRDTGKLEPAAVFGMFTYDYAGGTLHNREMDIEISKWGDPASKNSQFVVQPFYVASNVTRFNSPAGRLTHSFRWEEGRISFRTVRGAIDSPGARVVAQQVFTSGIPTPGVESARINLYVYRSAQTALREGAEVVVEQFTYIP